MHKKIQLFSFPILFFAFLISCGEPESENRKIEESVKEEQSGKQDQQVDSTGLLQMSQTIMEILEEKNYKRLAEFISEEEGLLFAPYTYIDSSNIVLTKDSLLVALDSGKFFMWGLADGKGDSIRMSIQKYFEEYVYDKNFIQSDTISFNQFVGSGNTINNIQEKFPRAKFVEYHFFGSEMYAGMDWKSLILVFDKVKDQYFLHAIVHNEWTV